MFHTIDICERVAEKLSQPDYVLSFIKKRDGSIKEEFSELSLAHGWPGLALFYSVLNHSFPHAQYDLLAHTYLELSVSKLSTLPFLPISLLVGVAGICFAVHLSSKEEERYSKLRAQLDNILIDKLDEHLLLMEQDVTPNSYTLAHGITGVLAYLLFRRSDSRFLHYTQKCVAKLVELMNREITFLDQQLSGWYEPNEYLWSDEARELYPNGKFTLGMLAGVSGILSTLSVAAFEGIRVQQLDDTISKLVKWLQTKQKELADGSMWPGVVSFEEEVGMSENHSSRTQKKWEEETPFVVRSLYLASRALNQQTLAKYAEDSFSKYLSAQEKRKENSDPSFIKGKAGTLAVAYRMSQDTRSPLFFKQVKSLEHDLTNSFDPSHPFGFPFADERKGAGILEGAAGIVLSLLLVQGREDVKWDRMFFLK